MRRYFIPEVIQTSAMDCGPASLKALFAGFGQYLSYGRLREACQTDLDGTSIDTLESVAQQLGLDVEQRMLPIDMLLLKCCACLPALIVTRLPDGATHFVVLWRVHGSRLQVMDPAGGRLWVERRRFLDSLYTHEHRVSLDEWREWSHSPEFTAALIERMRALGIQPELWSDRAHLDAALRLVAALAEARVIRTRGQVQEVFALCRNNPAQIPPDYWFARVVEEDRKRVRVRGAVLLAASALQRDVQLASLPESLACIRSEPPPRPWREVLTTLRAAGDGHLAGVAAVIALTGAGGVLEVLLFLGLIQSAAHLELTGQRVGALALVIALLVALLALDWAAAQALARLGRGLEITLRSRLLLKLPALPDRYFRSRLISDMAFRAHSLQGLRELPELAGRFIRCIASLAVTATAISFMYPSAALAAWIAVAASAGIPCILQPVLNERDMRVRELAGSLTRFYLDALLGARAIQAHGAERTMRMAQATQLAQWADASLRQQLLSVVAETVQLACALAPVLVFVLSPAPRAYGSTALLLLIYWLLSIPATGQELASIIWGLPRLRNTLVRYLEPLGAAETTDVSTTSAITIPSQPDSLRHNGVKVDIDNATVAVSGHVVLDAVNLKVEPGEHVGVVGHSGAGKSALMGLLLGWHEPNEGAVRIDGAPLDRQELARLRACTAWIDPQVHLFRATLLDNLCYGNGAATPDRLDELEILDEAGLIGMLRHLPEGMLTQLGEGGTLLAGGEGQRIRIARALAKDATRLAILDEPWRGLPRATRTRLLRTARKRFAAATLLFVTHDIRDTLALDRVVVVQSSRIVEQGVPEQLAADPSSHYRALLDAQQQAEHDVWSPAHWRSLYLRGGKIEPQ